MAGEESVVGRDGDAVDAPHRHVPVTYSEPYLEGGVVWTVPICECGLALTARPVRAVPHTPDVARYVEDLTVG
jgi:hypothetical protein